jgi:GUN4-like
VKNQLPEPSPSPSSNSSPFPSPKSSTTASTSPSSDSHSPKPRPFVTDLDYSKLEKFLIARNWQDANLETRNLMFKAQNQNQKELELDVERIKNFPCEVLNKIDSFWVKNSNGKFGFSVQNQIYKSCGGKYEWQFNDDKFLNCFFDKLGWRVKGSSAEYYIDINYNISAPKGHLPTCVVMLNCNSSNIKQIFSKTNDPSVRQLTTKEKDLITLGGSSLCMFGIAYFWITLLRRLEKCNI